VERDSEVSKIVARVDRVYRAALLEFVSLFHFLDPSLAQERGESMDTLAGYGSDDDSDLSSRETKNASAPPDARELSGLLGNVSDTSDASEADDDDLNAHLVTKAEESVSKKQKLEPVKQQSSNPLTVNYFGIDPKYLEGRPKLKLKDAPSTLEMQQSLEQIAQKLPADVNGLAEHLKRQQDFHNPHIFASVVEHFNIQNPLGSVAVPHSELKDFEKALFPDLWPPGDTTH